MIDKLGYVDKPLSVDVENVQKESAPVSNDTPVKVEVSHAFQEAQLTQSKKGELAMFGSIQQRLIGAELQRIEQPATNSVSGAGGSEQRSEGCH